MAELEKGILPYLVGGLGNQMFIASAGYVAHRYSNLPLYILQNNNPTSALHNIKRRNYNETVFRYFGIHLSCFQDDPLYKELFKDYSDCLQSGNGFSPWFPQSVRPGTRMSNYYQFYPALEVFEHELRHLFCKGIEQLMNKFVNYEDCAFLHVRRGDYLNMPSYHFIQSIEYYKNAVANLLETTKTIRKIYVVSDGIEWVKNQEFFHLPIFEIYESDDELDTLALMASCKAGAICGNSTFSWWGAFLGAYGKRSPVYVPKRWIAEYVPSLFPTEWNILE